MQQKIAVVKAERSDQATPGTSALIAEPPQQAEAAVGHDFTLPELRVEELTSQRGVRADYTSTRDGNNTPQLETSISDVQHPSSELGLTTEQPVVVACDCNRDETSVEKMDCSGGEFIQHLVDSFVAIQSTASELKAEQDGNDDADIALTDVADVTLSSAAVSKLDTDEASKTDSIAEVPVTCTRDASSTQCAVAEQTTAGVEKLPDDSELDMPATAVSITLSGCRDAGMKTDTDSVVQLYSNHCDVDDDSGNMPAETAETDLNATVIKHDEHAEVMDESDDRDEPACVRKLDVEVPGNVSNETVLSEVLASTVEAVGSESTMVKCGKETQLVEEHNEPVSCSEVNCARNVDTDAAVVSNELVLSVASSSAVLENVASVNVVKSESECTSTSDEEKELMDEFNKAASYSEVNHTAIEHADASVEMLSGQVSYVGSTSETSAYVMHRPSPLLQPSAETPDMDYSISRESDVRVVDSDIEFKLSSRTDSLLPCDAVQETEVCCIEGEKQSSAVEEHEQEPPKQAESVEPVLEPEEQLKQFNDVGLVQESAELGNSVEPVIDDTDGILKQCSSVDSVMEGNEMLVNASDNIEPVAAEARDALTSSGNVASVPIHDDELLKHTVTVQLAVEGDGELLEQCKNVESAMENGGDLLQQPETVVEPVAEDEKLSKHCHSVAAARREDGELLKVASNADSVMEHDRGLLNQSEKVEQVVAGCKDIDSSVLEDNGKMLKQSGSYDSVLAHQRDQLQQLHYDETMEVEITAPADEVVKSSCTDGATNVAGNVPGLLEGAEECTACDMAPSDLAADVLGGVVSASSMDLSPDDVSETVTAFCHQLCASPITKEPEYEASVPVSVLVSESEPESLERSAAPISVSVRASEPESVEESIVAISATVPEAVEGSAVPIAALIPESEAEAESMEMATAPISVVVSEFEPEPEALEVSTASVSAVVPEFEPESEPDDVEVSAVPISAVVPEPEAVEVSTANVSAVVPESEFEPEAAEMSIAPVSAVVPEFELEVEPDDVKVSAVLISAVVPESVQVSTVPVMTVMPESEAMEGFTVPVSAPVSESEPEFEAAKEFTVPVSKLVPHTDRSYTDELELSVPEEKEMESPLNAIDAMDTGMPLEDPVFPPLLQSDLHDKHVQQDDATVTSVDNSSAVVWLNKQVLDSDTEVGISTMETFAPNSIEGSETCAQAAVSPVKQYEHKADASCAEPTTPDDAVDTSSEDAFRCSNIVSIADKDTATCALNSENTVQSEVVTSAVGSDADQQLEDAVESAVISFVLVRDTLVHTCSSEDTVQNERMISEADKDTTLTSASSGAAEHSTVMTAKDMSVHTACSDNTVESKFMISTDNEGPAVLLASSEDAIKMADEVAIASGNTLVPTVHGSVISIPDEDTALNAHSSEDTVQSDVTVSAADKDAAIDTVSLGYSVQSEGANPLAEKDAVINAEDMTVSIVTNSLPHTSALVTDSEDTYETGVPISMTDNDASVCSGGAENTEHCEPVISTAVNNTAMHVSVEDTVQSMVLLSAADEDLDVNKSSENPAQSGVMVSVTDNDEAASVTGFEGTVKSEVMISVADEDAVMVTGICSSAECEDRMLVSADIGTSVDQDRADEAVSDAAGQSNSQMSNSSVEEGQFDDVESDDNAELATPTSSRRQLCYVSPALRPGHQPVGHAMSRVLNVRRNLPPVSPSSFGRSPAGTPSSRHSPVVTNRSMSTFVQPMPGRSPLLSSPVGQNVDTIGRPGTRPRFPQSPIMQHSGAYSATTGLQICDNSRRLSLLVGNTESSSSEKFRKRKRSADDIDVSSKRSLVDDFVGNNTVTLGPCDVVPAENAVISSGCDTEDVTVTATTTVVDSMIQDTASSEKLQDENGASSVTVSYPPVISMPCDDCSVTADSLAVQTTKSSEIMSVINVHDKENVFAESESSVVDGILSQEDTPTVQSDLLNNQSLNLDTEDSERPGMVENVQAAFTLVETESFVSAEVMDSEGTNVASKLDDTASNCQTSVSAVADTACCSQLDSVAESMELGAEYSSGNGAEVDHAADNQTLLVTTSHDYCIDDCMHEQQDLLKVEVTSSTSASNVKETSFSDSCSVSAHVNAEPVDCAADVPRTDKELPENMSTDVDVALPSSLENSDCVTDSVQILSSHPPCFAKPLCNQASMPCTQENIFSDKTATHLLPSDAADASTTSFGTDEFFASQCASQVTGEISASQATVGSDVTVGDVFLSQCISQATKDDLCISHDQADTNSDAHDLQLFLELSQEPSTSHALVRSQEVSQEVENEVYVSHSQTTTCSDTDGLHLYLEPSQGPSSLDALDHRKPQLTNSAKLFESEDELPTDIENNLETASESDLLMELRERGVSSQSTAGGLDHSRETAGWEEEDAASEFNDDNLCGISDQMIGDRLPHYLKQGDHQYACELRGCKEDTGAEEWMTAGEDAASIETRVTVDGGRIESDIAGKLCDCAVLDSHDNEFSAEEGRILSVIVEEEESDSNMKEAVSTDDATDRVDKVNGTDKEIPVDVIEQSVKTSVCSPVKCDADGVADTADVNDDCTGDYDALDVTESIDSSTDKDIDVAQQYEKDTACSPLKHDVHITITDDDDDDVSGAGITEDTPGYGSSMGNDVCSHIEHNIHTVAAAADRASDENGDADGSDGTDSISETGSGTGKDVELTWSSHEPAAHSPVNCDPCEAVAGNPGDPGDDDDGGGDDDGDSVSDVTESIPDVDSDDGDLSDAEENVVSIQQQAVVVSNDNSHTLSPQSVPRLPTECPASVGNIQTEELLAGNCCSM